jgi:hypothetical protein
VPRVDTAAPTRTTALLADTVREVVLDERWAPSLRFVLVAVVVLGLPLAALILAPPWALLGTLAAVAPAARWWHHQHWSRQ